MTSLQPDGTCWCGCGGDAARGSFFQAGHDKRAEAAVVKTRYGTIPDFLVAHGFGPGGKNPSLELERYQRTGGEYL